MESQTIDRRALRREIAILALCIIAFTTILVGLRYFIIAYVAPAAGTVDAPETRIEEINNIPARTLTGTVVRMSSDGVSLRLAVPGEGVYAIGIERLEVSARERIIENLGDTFTFYVTSEAATSEFDFAAHGVEVKEPIISIEERLNRIESMGGVEY